ncbi:MAG: SBBP repeat-containing protein [Bryobacterales bacterium]
MGKLANFIRAASLFAVALTLPAQTLKYATFFGGEFAEQANGVALDGEGNVYIVGQTRDLVAAPGSFTSVTGTSEDVFVLKLDPTLSRVIYFSVFGGSARERGSAIAVDAQGAAYVTGLAFSEDFPTTAGALQKTFGGGTRDAFVAKLSPDGSRLEYATYLGGSGLEDGNAIRVDESGTAYVAGTTGSADFATTPGAFLTALPAESQRAAFVVKLSPDGSTLELSTLLSGGAREEAFALTLDQGKLWIAGYSASPSFPATANAFQPTRNGADDAFIARLSADGSALEAATLLGGATCVNPFGGVPCDQVRAIHIDGGRVIVAGDTLTPDFPLAGPSLQHTFGGGVAFGDAFAAIFDLELSRLEWSTYLGGSDEDQINSIVTNPSGDIFAVGTTGSADFPLTADGVVPAERGLDEGFLVQIDPVEGTLLYSGLLGGVDGDRGYAIATDFRRTIVMAGETSSRGFQSTPGVVQPSLVRVRNEGGDAYIAKFDFQPVPRFSTEAVVNAASFRNTGLAPGEIISVFGRALGPPTPAALTLDAQGRVANTLGGVRLLINGVPAPLTFVGAGQINAVVPYAAAGLPVAELVVENGGAASAPITLLTSATTPALFTLSGAGSGPAAALNQDGTVNTTDNPVKRGEVIVLYGTGEGALLPAQPDGAVSAPPLSAPQADITVRIGNANAQVEYAGPAPGFVSGVLQINARVPVSVLGGPATPISFTAGQTRSPAGVTIAVD